MAGIRIPRQWPSRSLGFQRNKLMPKPSQLLSGLARATAVAVIPAVLMCGVASAAVPIRPEVSAASNSTAGQANVRSASGTTFTGTVPSPVAGGWRLNGSSVLSGTGLQLTNATTPQQAGSAFWPTPLDPASIDVAFDAAIDSGTGADGMTLTFADATSALPTALGINGDGLGFGGIPGVAVALDTHKGTADPSSNFIGVATGASSSDRRILTWAATTTAILALRNIVRHIQVTVLDQQLTVSVDGSQVLTTRVILPAKTQLGFTGSDGGKTDRHAVSNVVITKVRPAVPTPPAAPTGLVVAAGNGSAQVTWTTPTDVGSAAITGYVVQASAGGPTVTVDGNPVPSAATVSSLVNGSSYFFTVAAVNSAGTGPAAQSTSVTPLDSPNRQPAKFEPANGRTYIGVGAKDMATVDLFDQAVGNPSHPAIYNNYTTADGIFKGILDKAITRPGVTPMISWNVVMTNQSVTNGSKDAYLTAQAAAAKSYSKPIFLRLDWEMNGTWAPNYDVTGGVSAQQYIDSWRYIHRFFDAVPNVAFVWCPNGGRYNPAKLSPFAWYPGDTQVDWIGMDSYPDYDPNPNFAVTGQDGLNDFAVNASAYNKPLMLAEWARGADATTPDTSSTVNLVFDWAERYPNTVKALVYFDFAGSGSHELETHPVSAAAFASRTAGNAKYLNNLVTTG